MFPETVDRIRSAAQAVARAVAEARDPENRRVGQEIARTLAQSADILQMQGWRWAALERAAVGRTPGPLEERWGPPLRHRIFLLEHRN